MKNRVTIADVANYIGVSKSTVSHALSGKRSISSEVRSQVNKAVLKLGYRPNFAARAMNTSQTGLIGLLVPGLQNYFTTSLVDAFGRELSRNSLQMVLAVTAEVSEAENVLRKFSAGMTDGIINALPDLRSERATELAGGTPVLTYMRHSQSPLFVDFAAGIRQALNHLTRLGHRDIAMISSHLRAEAGECDPCEQGYCDYVAEYGLKSYIWKMEHDEIADGYHLAPEVFGSGVTAVLAGNDMAAGGLIQWAIERNLPLPETMSIIGLDDTPLAQMVYPPLTTLNLSIRQLVEHTVKVLLATLNPMEPEPGPLRVVPQLIERRSTGPVFIRKQDKE